LADHPFINFEFGFRSRILDSGNFHFSICRSALDSIPSFGYWKLIAIILRRINHYMLLCSADGLAVWGLVRRSRLSVVLALSKLGKNTRGTPSCSLNWPPCIGRHLCKEHLFKQQYDRTIQSS
jgi:hypothetical protein